MKVRNLNRDTLVKAYLTKRILLSSASKAIQIAAKRAMEINGYVVVAKNGWVVKKFADGHTEQLIKLEIVKSSSKIVLD